jgi:hypothetical protein
LGDRKVHLHFRKVCRVTHGNCVRSFDVWLRGNVRGARHLLCPPWRNGGSRSNNKGSKKREHDVTVQSRDISCIERKSNMRIKVIKACISMRTRRPCIDLM